MKRAHALLLALVSLATFLGIAGCTQIVDASNLPAESTGALRHQEIERTYQLFVPSSYDGTAVPLVLVFHERHASGREISRTTRFNVLAERERFIVAYPDAVNGIWNDGRPNSNTSTDDVGFSRALIEHLSNEFAIDSRRIYATGYSNGGHMVNRLVLQMQDTFAAAAPVASLLSSELAFLFPPPAAGTPILLIHGTSDPITPFTGGPIAMNYGVVFSAISTIDYWVDANKASPEAIIKELPDNDPSDGTRVRRETHTPLASQGAEVQLVIVEGGGHTWARGETALPSIFIGATSRDFSATEEIWSFFSRHQR